MLDAFKKLARCRLRLFELELDKEHPAGIKHLAESAVCRLPTDGSDKSKLNCEIPVLSINPKRPETTYSTETETQLEKPVDYGIPQ